MRDHFADPSHLSQTADVMGRACKSWQGSTASYHFAVRDMIKSQAAEILDLRKKLEGVINEAVGLADDESEKRYVEKRLRAVIDT